MQNVGAGVDIEHLFLMRGWGRSKYGRDRPVTTCSLRSVLVWGESYQDAKISKFFPLPRSTTGGEKSMEKELKRRQAPGHEGACGGIKIL